MPKYKAGIDYAQRLRAIRRFVTFDYDLRKPLSSAAKTRINTYYDYVDKLTVREHFVYRPKRADRLKKAQAYAQQNPRYNKLAVAFIPKGVDKRPRVAWNKKGELHIRGENIERVAIFIDRDELLEAEDTAQYIDDLINDASPAKRYSIMAGEFEIPITWLRSEITRKTLQFMSKYDADKPGCNPDKNSSHYWGNWLFGINGYNFRNQQELTDYKVAQTTATKQRARERFNARRRDKRVRERDPLFWINHVTKAVKRGYPPQPENWQQCTNRQYWIAIGRGYRELP